jgi:short-subunit dehydrogenase
MQLKPIREQTIVITGGSSGIGLATAKLAASKGAHVILIARDEASATEVCQKIKQAGGRADYVSADVGERDQVAAAMTTITSHYGGFDTWVNNAGIGAYATLEQLDDANHQEIFRVNYWGVVYGSTEALKILKTRGGALINLGSIASDMPAPLLSAYAASKHAVKGFTDSLRLELLHEEAPVSVTLIQPSGIHTPFADHALNLTGAEVKVPPPLYAPEVVAQAIVRAAEHPTRDAVIGGAGRLQLLFTRLAPRLADRVINASFYGQAIDHDKPARSGKIGNGQINGRQSDSMRHSSVYTSLRQRPMLLSTVILATGLVATALSRLKRSTPYRT